jgi:tRNA-specific 2-thiouridylase
VVAKDIEHNTVRVTHGSRLQEHARRVLRVEQPHWVGEPPARSELLVRLRHGQRLLPCRLREAAGGALEIELAEADPGIAPGQFAVLYEDQVCLGGGPVAS